MFFTVALDVTTRHLLPPLRVRIKSSTRIPSWNSVKRETGLVPHAGKVQLKRHYEKKKQQKEKKTILCSDTWNKMFYQRKMQIAISGNKM